MVSNLAILDRPIYGVAQAAGLLRLSAERTRAWLDGYSRNGVLYPPVVRPEPSGSDIVTWGEFVELGYLREYRRDVALQRIRPVLARLREFYDSPYPLATHKPWIYGHELVLQA